MGEHSLSEAVRVVRRALGDASQHPVYIQTVHRKGYRFVAPVRRDDIQAAPAPFASRRNLYVGALLVFVVGTAAGWWVIAKDHRSPEETLSFGERDWVLITRIDNRTGERGLDGVLEHALAREIGNSSFVNVVPRQRVEDTLRLMGKPLDTSLEPSVGREVCIRDSGIRAMVAGRIETLGSNYRLSVSLIDPSNGLSVADASEAASSREELWGAVRRLSNWARGTLGERLKDVSESSQALERVTTPSFEALKFFTEGSQLKERGDFLGAEPLLRRALAKDPSFASAHTWLAYVLRNQGKDEEAVSEARLGMELSQKYPGRERLFSLATYYRFTKDNEKALATYSLLLQIAPDHHWARNNMGNILFGLGRHEVAAMQWKASADLLPDKVSRLHWRS